MAISSAASRFSVADRNKRGDSADASRLVNHSGIRNWKFKFEIAIGNAVWPICSSSSSSSSSNDHATVYNSNKSGAASQRQRKTVG